MKTQSRRRLVILFLLAAVLAFAFLGFSPSAKSGEAETTDPGEILALKEAEKPLIVIDPGHGGEDPGASSASGVYEKDLNLAISRTLEKELGDLGFRVVLTREDDALVFLGTNPEKGKRKRNDLENRVRISEENPGAIFLSVHMNAFSGATCRGLQTYYRNQENSSYRLAECIQKQVIQSLQPTNHRKIKPGDDLYVLKNNPNTAVLIECGFLSDPVESELLCKKEYQRELSFAIACGIMDYLNLK